MMKGMEITLTEKQLRDLQEGGIVTRYQFSPVADEIIQVRLEQRIE